MLSNRLTERLRIPVPLLVLVASAVAVKAVPDLHAPPERIRRGDPDPRVDLHPVRRRHAHRRRPVPCRRAADRRSSECSAPSSRRPRGAALLHVGFGLGWFVALLVATAVAPTDPAVVFSVLGQREIAGRSGTVLEGESGANDPVGHRADGEPARRRAAHGERIRLGRRASSCSRWWSAPLVGLLGGRALLWFMRRVQPARRRPLPAADPGLRVAMLFGVATLAHGSGFLAVFVAGIVIGDEGAPYKREVERFHSALASLAEIVAFVVLGLTVDLDVLTQADVLVPGLVLAVVVAFVVRPVFVGLCLLPARLRRNENAFILFAGLKGAVPLLLGELMLAAGVHDAPTAVRDRRRGRGLLRPRAGQPDAGRRGRAQDPDARLEPSD